MVRKSSESPARRLTATTRDISHASGSPDACFDLGEGSRPGRMGNVIGPSR